MNPDTTVMSWAAEWQDPARSELIRDKTVDCLAGDEPPPFALVDIAFAQLDPDSPLGSRCR